MMHGITLRCPSCNGSSVILSCTGGGNIVPYLGCTCLTCGQTFYQQWPPMRPINRNHGRFLGLSDQRAGTVHDVRLGEVEGE